MNDFSDLENQLKALRPARLRENLVARIERAMAEAPSEISPPSNVVRPDRFRIYWATGLGLAAAAILLIFVRVNFRAPKTAPQLAAVSSPAPSPSVAPRPLLRDSFIPSGATEVVYHRR